MILPGRRTNTTSVPCRPPFHVLFRSNVHLQMMTSYLRLAHLLCYYFKDPLLVSRYLLYLWGCGNDSTGGVVKTLCSKSWVRMHIKQGMIFFLSCIIQPYYSDSGALESKQENISATHSWWHPINIFWRHPTLSTCGRNLTEKLCNFW